MALTRLTTRAPILINLSCGLVDTNGHLLGQFDAAQEFCKAAGQRVQLHVDLVIMEPPSFKPSTIPAVRV